MKKAKPKTKTETLKIELVKKPAKPKKKASKAPFPGAASSVEEAARMFAHLSEGCID